ncbi:hypothetical protein DK37_27700 [Halomonas sp. SUBG004]|nr:hypothetical protein DK37_27700 [Halomonas sp. SUBG004]
MQKDDFAGTRIFTTTHSYRSDDINANRTGLIFFASEEEDTIAHTAGIMTITTTPIGTRPKKLPIPTKKSG